MENIAYETSYTISDIAKMKSVSEQCVLHDIYHGRLPVHAWLPVTLVDEIRQQTLEGQLVYTKSEKTYEGYIQLYPSDVRHIMRSNRMPIRCFPGKTSDEEIVLRKGVANYWIAPDDLVILKESLGRTPQHKKGGDMKVTAIARLSDIIPDLQVKIKNTSSHDSSFCNITFKGQEFAFGLVQADIIKQLFKSAVGGEPKVHFKRLFVEAGSQSLRMRDVFKSQPDWKDLICHDNRGYYWLHPDFIDAVTSS